MMVGNDLFLKKNKASEMGWEMLEYVNLLP